MVRHFNLKNRHEVTNQQSVRNGEKKRENAEPPKGGHRGEGLLWENGHKNDAGRPGVVFTIFLLVEPKGKC